MTIKELKAQFTQFGEDVTFEVRETDEGLWLYIEICDFIGFADDWSEIYSDLDEEAIDEVIDKMKATAIHYTTGMYPVFEFEGFKVRISYTSYDI
jgi:hypothetical protein